MKKLIPLWLMMILSLIIITGCKIQSVEEYNNQTEQEQSVDGSSETKVIVKGDKGEVSTKEEIEKDSTIDAKKPNNEEEKKTETKQKEQKNEAKVTPKKEQPTSTPKTESTPTSKTPSKDTSTSSNKEKPDKSPAPSKDKSPSKDQKPDKDKKPENNNVAQKPSKPNKEDEKKKEYVTISISATTLLTHWDMLKPALQSEKYVPKNGVILKSTKYEILNEDETVWSILRRATNEHGIHLEYEGAGENQYGSVYIEGMNHLYEFDAGDLSGWMYSVNGQFPSYGVSAVTVKNGDNIQFQYTVDLGRDIGK
ncbi:MULTISPECIES: DUF4430 domain-containing protein [unclassified Viridibacillus]|uniref:DUF4430 domain-containing protein n=1 Tax=unclassified Viridibacillus TaxID=2617942 RepID=UPI00096E028F|nr:DUF4430 domain-containing protein [Viridibacillus sp. FSL H8-0123]OMC84751.1 hypothetical protein BK130_03820 [Viridibacillus sp. FSL H8-0123]